MEHKEDDLVDEIKKILDDWWFVKRYEKDEQQKKYVNKIVSIIKRGEIEAYEKGLEQGRKDGDCDPWEGSIGFSADM